MKLKFFFFILSLLLLAVWGVLLVLSFKERGMLFYMVEGIITFSLIIRKSKFPPNPERSVQFSGKRTKRSVQKIGCTQHL